MAGSRIDLEAELDRLFALPPGDFVAARNVLAAHFRVSGDASALARIKALKRPTVPAWAVNQLRFEAPRILAALLASGSKLRSRSSDIPGAMQARREAISAARKKAAELLVAAGHAATPQTMQRVSSTLEALATYGNAPDRGLAGRLTVELPAPGFDELASLGILRSPAATPRVPRPRSPVPPAPVARVSDKAGRMSARERADRAKTLSARNRRPQGYAGNSPRRRGRPSSPAGRGRTSRPLWRAPRKTSARTLRHWTRPGRRSTPRTSRFET